MSEPQVRYMGFEVGSMSGCWFTAHPAEVGSEPIGRLHIVPREYAYGGYSIYRYAEIRALTVDEGRRREGIGAELVRLALAWAQENGFERVAVEASARPDAPGAPFYEAQGFTPRSIVLDIELP